MSNWTDPLDPCTAYGITISAPPNLQSQGSPYIAIGPISNFTSTIQSCCHGSVHNYNGGPASSSCYYYCTFNGTVQDMRDAFNCDQEAGRQVRKDNGLDMAREPTQGFSEMGWHPDLDARSAGTKVYGTKWGVWRCAVFGMVLFGAVAGAL